MQIVIDGLPCLSVGGLKRAGLFRAGRCKVGRGEWVRENQARRELTVKITADFRGVPFVVLEYANQGGPVVDKLALYFQPSNLGRGFIPYFICPVTGRSCRKLYFVGGRFVSRYAFRGIYAIQAAPTSRREVLQSYAAQSRYNALIDERPRRRLMYGGKPTRYARQLNAAEQADKQAERVLFAFRIFGG